MLFHTQGFLLLFLPAVLLLYYRIAHRRRARTWLLILASTLFYGWWEPRLLPLLVASVGVNWLLAAACREIPVRLLVPVGVGLNLAVLGVFKYADFFAGAIAAVTGTSHEGFGIILPLGISFFTFQQIAYLVDLKRARAPWYRFEDYALFVTFFPQLIAGPIVRHGEIIPQYAHDPCRPGLDERLARGLVLLLIGIGKKVLLADPLGDVADPLFAQAGEPDLGAAAAWTAVGAFALQIYFDFSGYSDMAIGLALMFGLHLPFNFDAPYRAASVREFWHRWHMTLSRFLRDYLYIPLGGSRHGPTRAAAALLVTMVLGGLWHGAAWTFVAWGGLHGLALVVAHAWHRAGLALPRTLAWPLTLAFVVVAWIPFRAPDLGTAAALASGLLAPGGGLPAGADLALVGAGAALAVLGPTSQTLALQRLPPRRELALAGGLGAVALLLAMGGGRNVEFIYFQF